MFILLFLFWIALNGQITAEIILLGLVITTFVYWLMCKHFEYSPKNDVLLFKNTFRIIQYLIVLLWEIIKSSFAVIKMTFISKIDVQPQIVFFDVPLKNEFLRVVLANSITITPGTITVNVE
ncbi:MAG: Na+/H+ antiporter subunit E, partial [Oscillospiraceae bacterium]